MTFCPYCGLRLTVDKETLKIKLDDIKHDEIISFALGVIGFIFLLRAMWLGSFTATTYEWRGPTLYEVTYHPYAEAAIAISIIAVIMIALGFGASAYYSYKRSKLIKQLESK